VAVHGDGSQEPAVQDDFRAGPKTGAGHDDLAGILAGAQDAERLRLDRPGAEELRNDCAQGKSKTGVHGVVSS
jgi:hypothetical protein